MKQANKIIKVSFCFLIISNFLFSSCNSGSSKTEEIPTYTTYTADDFENKVNKDNFFSNDNKNKVFKITNLTIERYEINDTITELTSNRYGPSTRNATNLEDAMRIPSNFFSITLKNYKDVEKLKQYNPSKSTNDALSKITDRITIIGKYTGYSTPEYDGTYKEGESKTLNFIDCTIEIETGPISTDRNASRVIDTLTKNNPGTNSQMNTAPRMMDTAKRARDTNAISVIDTTRK